MSDPQGVASSVVVREYRSADFKCLYDIDQAAFPKGIAYSYLELQYYVRSSRSRTLVAQDAGEVVGFVIGWIEPQRLGHIITIDVTPHRQRQRIGSLLLKEIESWLWSRGASAVYLETPADDEGAKGFYSRHGYWIIESIEGYYNDSLDALVMMKTAKRHQG
jgi:ribosomal-protein-alanine N-acetyltransferase